MAYYYDKEFKNQLACLKGAPLEFEESQESCKCLCGSLVGLLWVSCGLAGSLPLAGLWVLLWALWALCPYGFGRPKLEKTDVFSILGAQNLQKTIMFLSILLFLNFGKHRKPF